MRTLKDELCRNKKRTPEDGVRLTQFYKAYSASIETQAAKILGEQAKANNRRHNIKPLNNACFYRLVIYQNLDYLLLV